MRKKRTIGLAAFVTLLLSSFPLSAETISWEDAAKYVGKEVTVTGTIVAANNTGKVCFLNFDKDYKKSLSVVIFAGNFSKFPPDPEGYYLNKIVEVTGLIKDHNGTPEIIISGPDRIRIK
ncbi:MAG: hypothetical protein V1798_09730 [Pseudomonadota bacterium]